ncbi:hypothetical protein ACFPRL_34615 [Pseudoclavibacter helvolus]
MPVGAVDVDLFDLADLLVVAAVEGGADDALDVLGGQHQSLTCPGLRGRRGGGSASRPPRPTGHRPG